MIGLNHEEQIISVHVRHAHEKILCSSLPNDNVKFFTEFKVY